jgi:chromosome segregation ATPase
MAKKLWNQLSTDEKLEALREDVAQAYDVLNRLIADVGTNHRRLNQIEPKLTEVSKAVEALKHRLPKSAA